MRLSIITINYNNAEGLRQTLASVAMQTCRDIEHIIIDGGSKDGSAEVIKDYVRQLEIEDWNLENVKWVSESDKGIYDAMNRGIKKASGEYLYFLNSGDTLAAEQVVERLYKELESGEEDIIVSCINFTDASGVYHANYQKRMSKISLFHYLQTGIPHQSALIHRSLFTQYGLYDLQYHIVADWEFFLRALVLNKASLRYTDLTIANFDGTGLTSTHGKEMGEEIEKVMHDTFPERVLEDYKWMQASGSDLRRMEWLQAHPFMHRLVQTIVGLGRRISK